MGKYVQTSEVRRKLDHFSDALSGAMSNEVKYMRTSTIDDYKYMLEELEQCQKSIYEFLSHNSVSLSNNTSEASDMMSALWTGFRNLSKFDSDLLWCIDCASNLTEWFNKRYEIKSNFQFTASKIPDFIDTFIISYSYCMKTNTLAEFYKELGNWYKSLSEHNYPLPAYIINIAKAHPDVNPECVVLEHEIKKSLYIVEPLISYSDTLLTKYKSSWIDEPYEYIRNRCI